MLTTIQDLGREGFGPLGVSASGAADPIALRIGNRLAGNPENTAAIEMTLLGGTFLFEREAAVALAGAEFNATLDGEAFPAWTSRMVRAGQTLRGGGAQCGARAYVCVQGGIAVPLLLGSASTHLLSGLGGLEGRALRKGDVLRIGASGAEPFRPRVLKPSTAARLAPRPSLRVTAGPQWNAFPETARRALFESAYRVTDDSNRMGLRLEGAELASPARGTMISEGVALGAIQIPAGGQPIILFVEQQTTGGYPKIANVIAADLPSIGQLRPRDEIRFELVSMEKARALIREQETFLRQEDLFIP